MLETQVEQCSTIKKTELINIYDVLNLAIDDMEGVKEVIGMYLQTDTLPSVKAIGALLTTALDASKQLDDACNLLERAVANNTANV